MKQWIVIISIVAACVLGGCSSQLAYLPEEGSPAVPVSAQHHQTDDRMYVYVNTEGIPVESAVLVLSDGQQLRPVAIHRPSELSGGIGAGQDSVSGGMYGGATGVTAGGFGFGSSGTFSTTRESSVGVGMNPTSRRDLAQTIVIFPVDRVGAGPWRFRVKIENHPDVSIVLPALEAAN